MGIQTKTTETDHFKAPIPHISTLSEPILIRDEENMPAVPTKIRSRGLRTQHLPKLPKQAVLWVHLGVPEQEGLICEY